MLLNTSDQVTTIAGQTINLGANSSSTISLVIPPLPDNFPTINADCDVLGSASLVTVACGFTAIEDVLDANSFILYPNPNNGSFTVQVDLLQASDVHLSIVDVTGRMLMNQLYTNEFGTFNKVINLENNMSSGFYVLNLNINGENVQKHFIVK